MTRPLILVVEDDPHFGRQLDDLFDFLGYKAYVAESGVEALSYAGAHSIDFLLTDLMLPGMSGVELVKKIRARPDGDRLPVMMMSAIYKNPRMFEKELRELGVLEFLAKPFSLIDLGRKIDAVLDDDVQLDIDDAQITATGSWRLDEINQALGEAKPDFEPLGSWDRASLVGILIELFRQHAAGVLTLRRLRSRRELYLLNGYPVWATSDEPDETLGAVLVDLGTLDQLQVDDLHARASRDNVDFREAVLSSGGVSEQDLMVAERQRVRRIVVRSFAWSSGEYQWIKGDEFVERVPVFEVNPVRCLGEAVPRYLPLTELANELLQHSDRLFVEGSRRRRLGSYLTLPEGLEGLLGRMDGSCTVGDLFARHRERRDALVPLLWLMFRLDIAATAEAPPAPLGQRLIARQGVSEGARPPRPVFVPTRDELCATDERQDGILQDYLTLMQGDHYRFLGVERDASVGVIVRAYSDRKQHYRMERLTGLSSDARNKRKELLARLELAFSALTSPSKRSAYDAELRSREQTESQRGPGPAQRLRSARELLRAGDDIGAQEVLEELAVRHPNSAEVLFLLGQARHRMASGPDGLVTAREALQRALKIDPFHAGSLRTFAEVARGQGDEPARSAAVEQVRELDPDDPWLLSAVASK